MAAGSRGASTTCRVLMLVLLALINTTCIGDHHGVDLAHPCMLCVKLLKQ
jgi:hypothetical protein